MARFCGRLPTDFVIAFTEAKYVSGLSHLHSLYDCKPEDAPARLATIKHYVTQYLAHLAFEGQSIIHSVPVYKWETIKESKSSTAMYLTSASYQVITRTEITVTNCHHGRHDVDAPVLLLLGMSGGRVLPSFRIPWSYGWVLHGQGIKSVGSLVLSKRVFLEEWLLPKLMDINAKTTVVPKFAGQIDGVWEFDLVAWNQHEYRKGRNCPWKLKGKNNGHLEYIWEHRDDWKHEHVGSNSEEANGEYTISCEFDIFSTFI
jgi:hypothetical protein